MSTVQTVVITGASRGIGYLLSKTIALRGHRVYATMRGTSDRNLAAANDLKQWATHHDTLLTVLELDVTDESSVVTAISHIEEAYAVDVVVNNAGVMPVGLTEAYTMDQLRSIMDVNFFGVASVSRAVLPAMRARKAGLLINMSSSAGRLSIPYFGLYCASKWAVEAYTESLNFELEPFGIESIIVEPSGHGTDLVETAPIPQDVERLASYGDIAAGGGRLLGMFKTMFEAEEDATNAQNVADCIAALVDMKTPRPLRTTIGQDMGVEAINQSTMPVQHQLIDGLKPVYSGSQ